MTLRSLKIIPLFVLGCLPALLPAQVETTGKEEERLEQLARSQGEWAAAPKSKLSVGFRVMSSGGQVDFQNLGAVPSSLTIAPASAGLVTREYHNGSVRADAARASERDANGNVTSTPGGRYDVFTTVTVDVVDGNGVVTGTQAISVRIGDLLSYTPGLTREWSAATANQLTQRPGFVAFSNFSTTSDGGSARHEQGPTGGVEFLFSREIGRGSRFLQWGMVAGITLNDINSKSSGVVSSTLHTYTDFFSANGIPISANQLDNPTFTTLFDSSGQPVAGTNYEYTVAISGVPAAASTDTAVAGAASVDGRWQVKGSYFMFRFGPSLRTRITDRLGLTASLGLAGAYAGTRYTAFETFSVAALPDVTFETDEASTAAKFVTGYFADVSVEWAANEVLGLFGGVTAQQLGDYEQKLSDRSAKIDLGSSVGLRGGVSIRF